MSITGCGLKTNKSKKIFINKYYSKYTLNFIFIINKVDQRYK